MKAIDLVNSLITSVKKLFNLERYNQLVKDVISKEYRKGLEESEEQLDMNFTVEPERENDIVLLSQEQIKGFDEEMTKKLKEELMRGIVNNDDNRMIKKKLIDFFSNKPNVTKFNWNDRLNTILRTERTRANNKGRFDGAIQSNIKGLRKYLSVIVDDRTSDICLEENQKYGSVEQSIPMDEPFVVRVNNKTYSAMFPPFHPNCRTEIMIDTSRVERD